MTRDEILAKSRIDNSGQDERELHISRLAGSISKVVGGLVCVLIAFFVTMLSDELSIVHVVCWCIYTSLSATEELVRAIMLRTNKLHWIFSICFLLLFVCFVLLFVQEMIVWTIG